MDVDTRTSTQLDSRALATRLASSPIRMPGGRVALTGFRLGSSSRVQRGVSLLEVLIAVLVLAVGILGATSLQLNALRYNASASHATQASFIAYDMLDRMRANSGNLASYTINVDACASTPAAPASVEAQDLTDFATAVGCRLPEGKGAILITGNRATVSIRWSDSRIRSGEADTEFVVSSLVSRE